jgi:hypothetical protein
MPTISAWIFAGETGHNGFELSVDRELDLADSKPLEIIGSG